VTQSIPPADYLRLLHIRPITLQLLLLVANELVVNWGFRIRFFVADD
jgi:hypothetical protein